MSFLSSLFGSLFGKKKPTTPPVPTPPPAPDRHALVIHIFNGDVSKDDKVVGASIAWENTDVLLTKGVVVSDDAGNAVLDHLLKGHYTLSVSVLGYDEYTTTVEVPATTEVNISLSKSAARDTIAGRLRVEQRRIKNDAGWFDWRGISDLAAVSDMLTGNVVNVTARLDNYQKGRRTVLRVCGMLAWATNSFSPSSVGYWAALELLVSLANARGMYVEICAFADAQIVMPNKSDREAFLRALCLFIQSHPGTVLQLANEPFKNGWTGATDADLLSLAKLAASLLGHKDFSIGDPGGDGGAVDPGQDVISLLAILSQYSNICVTHPDRGQYGDASRWRRWLDHLEGFVDAYAKMVEGTTLILDEPMGANPVYQDGRRDNDADAFVAAQAIGKATMQGYTYHWIVGEYPESDHGSSLPGLYDCADLIASIPVSPDWRYLNDSWPGAPTAGIRWTGKAGKLRNLVNGTQAWTVAYGEGDWNSITWRAGFNAVKVYERSHVCIWKVNQ